MVRAMALRLGMGTALVAASAFAYFGIGGFGGADAQGFPPNPPLVAYGKAPGTVAGQGVHAMVNNNGVWTYCGDGITTSQSGDGVGYVIQVESETQTRGCGAEGRNVRLYFSPDASYSGEGGRLSTGTFAFNATLGATVEYDATLGEPLEVRALVPMVAAKVE